MPVGEKSKQEHGRGKFFKVWSYNEFDKQEQE